MNQIETLLEEYQRVRRIQLNKDIFIYILKLYPSLLVCISDGALTDQEWANIMKMVNGLADEYVDLIPGSNKDHIVQNFRTEFRYLLENVERWHKKFLNALRSFIETNQDEKEFVQECMYLFANQGAKGISREAQKTINSLSDRLALEH